MLEIHVPENEFFDTVHEIFISTKAVTLYLEHSLISLSKWESKHEKPFLNDKDKTPEEIIDYIRCMTITKNVDPNCYLSLSEENLTAIQMYIDAKMTATTITNVTNERYGPRKTLTSELIYALMIEYGIPFECERWHLNRLIMLINVCKERSTPPKKMSKEDMLAKRRALNEQRLAAMKGGH